MQLHFEHPRTGFDLASAFGLSFGSYSWGNRYYWLRLWGPGRVAVQSVFDRMEGENPLVQLLSGNRHALVRRRMIDAAKLRAWYAHRQGLDGSLEGKSAAEVFRTHRVGAIGGRRRSPYLTLFCAPESRRESVDAWRRKARDL